jgi:hypothetical protein
MFAGDPAYRDFAVALVADVLICIQAKSDMNVLNADWSRGRRFLTRAVRP